MYRLSKLLSMRRQIIQINHLVILCPHLFQLELEIKRRVKLVGAELEEFRRKEALEKAKKDVAGSGLLGPGLGGTGDPLLDLDDDSSDEEMEVAASGKVVPKHDIVARPGGGGAAGAGSGSGAGKPGVGAEGDAAAAAVAKPFVKARKAKHLMFPFHEEKV